MASIVFSTAALLVILHYDIRPKWGGDRKVLWVSLAFLGIGYLVLVLSALGIQLPSPLDPVEALIKTLFPQITSRGN